MGLERSVVGKQFCRTDRVVGLWIEMFNTGGIDALKIGIERIDVHPFLLWQDHKIHIFHRNGTKKNLVPHDNGANVCNTILEPGLNWTHVWDHLL